MKSVALLGLLRPRSTHQAHPTKVPQSARVREVPGEVIIGQTAVRLQGSGKVTKTKILSHSLFITTVLLTQDYSKAAFSPVVNSLVQSLTRYNTLFFTWRCCVAICSLPSNSRPRPQLLIQHTIDSRWRPCASFTYRVVASLATSVATSIHKEEEEEEEEEGNGARTDLQVELVVEVYKEKLG